MKNRFLVLALLAGLNAAGVVAAQASIQVVVDTPIGEHFYRQCEVSDANISRLGDGDTIVADCNDASHYQQAFDWEPSVAPLTGSVTVLGYGHVYEKCLLVTQTISGGQTIYAVECVEDIQPGPGSGAGAPAAHRRQ